MTLSPVEKLTIENLPELLEIGHEFTTEVGYLLGKFDLPAFIETWGPVIGSGIGEVFVIRDGNRIAAALGSAFLKDAFSGHLTAWEQWWYALREYRGLGVANSLFDAFEAEAAKRGCAKIVMAHLATPQAEKLEALYTRRGYRPLEKTFVKEI